MQAVTTPISIAIDLNRLVISVSLLGLSLPASPSVIVSTFPRMLPKLLNSPVIFFTTLMIAMMGSNAKPIRPMVPQLIPEINLPILVLPAIIKSNTLLNTDLSPPDSCSNCALTLSIAPTIKS